MRFIAILALVGSTFLMASSPSIVECTGNRGTKIQVEVDVLESNPPQSQISVTSFGGEKSGFSAFTEHVVIETHPSIDQYVWKSRDGFLRLTVETRDGRSGKGSYSVGRMRAEDLKCELN